MTGHPNTMAGAILRPGQVAPIPPMDPSAPGVSVADVPVNVEFIPPDDPSDGFEATNTPMPTRRPPGFTSLSSAIWRPSGTPSDNLTLSRIARTSYGCVSAKEGRLCLGSSWQNSEISEATNNCLRNDRNVLEVTGCELDYDIEEVSFEDAVENRRGDRHPRAPLYVRLAHSRKAALAHLGSDFEALPA